MFCFLMCIHWPLLWVNCCIHHKSSLELKRTSCPYTGHSQIIFLLPSSSIVDYDYLLYLPSRMPSPIPINVEGQGRGCWCQMTTTFDIKKGDQKLYCPTVEVELALPMLTITLCNIMLLHTVSYQDFYNITNCVCNNGYDWMPYMMKSRSITSYTHPNWLRARPPCCRTEIEMSKENTFALFSFPCNTPTFDKCTQKPNQSFGQRKILISQQTSMTGITYLPTIITLSSLLCCKLPLMA